MGRFLALALVALSLLVASPAQADDREEQLFDRSQLRVFTGTASCDLADQDWTSYAAVCTITPAVGVALQDVEVTIDLAKASTGFAAGHTSQTITFTISKKVDGSNWRNDASLATTAISGTNAASSSVTLKIGNVSEDEAVRIVAKLSTESSAADFDLPVVVTYRSSVRATIGVVE